MKQFMAIFIFIAIYLFFILFLIVFIEENNRKCSQKTLKFLQFYTWKKI